SSAAGGQVTPDLAFDGAAFAVVWDDRRGTDADIYGAVVRISGGAIALDHPDGVAISVVAGAKQTQPAIAAIGGPTDGFAAVWTDARNAATTGTDLYGRTLWHNLVPLSLNEHAISVAAGDDSTPALTPGPSAAGIPQGLIAYRRVVAAYGTERIMAHQIGYDQSAASCSNVCSGPGCNLSCDGSSGDCNCQLDCAEVGGTCNASCESNDPACTIDCAGVETCNVNCKNGSACTVDCTGADACSNVKCQGGGGCLLDCTDSSDCRFKTCPGNNVISCPG